MKKTKKQSNKVMNDTDEEIVRLSRSIFDYDGILYYGKEKTLGDRIIGLLEQEQQIKKREEKRQRLIKMIRAGFYDMPVDDLVDKIMKEIR